MNKNMKKATSFTIITNLLKYSVFGCASLYHIGFLLLTIVSLINSQEKESSTENQEYRIEKPGTITFTVGVKIKGKVEKPQVMIFLPKEKTVYKEYSLNRSFSEEINTPLPFTPLIE